MSLLQMLSGLLDQHGDTAQQAALLAYLKQGEEAQPYLEAVLTARLANTLYRQVSKEDKYEAARNETILSIAQWVKEHPRATQVKKYFKTIQLQSAHPYSRHRPKKKLQGRLNYSNRKLRAFS